MGEHATVRPRRARPSRGRILARRLIALAVLAGGLGAAVWVTVIAVREIRPDPPPPPRVVAPPPPPKPLRIIFPEGFTRLDMARRIVAVKRIARRTRKVNARLSARLYLQATASHPIPGRFAGEPRTARGQLGVLAVPGFVSGTPAAHCGQ